VVLTGDTCGVTRPVGFHNGITEPTANGKATGVGADAETLSGLGVSARKNSDAPGRRGSGVQPRRLDDG